MLAHAVDYAPDGAVDFPALRARAHLSAPDGAVDYGPVGPVDYASGARCGLRASPCGLVD